jgi:hypothetical protein
MVGNSDIIVLAYNFWESVMPEQHWTPRIRRVNPNEQERLQFVGPLLREKRIDEARDELLSLLEQDARSVRAHLMLGALYQGQCMHAEALDTISGMPSRSIRFV